MAKVTTPAPKFKAFMLVRDADGIPKFDDPANVPNEIKKALTKEDIKKMDAGVVRTLGLGHLLEE